MQTTRYVTLAALAAAMGCASSLAGTEEQAAVGAAVEPLHSEMDKEFCNAVKGEIVENAMWASTEAAEARQAFEDNPDNELVMRYFGEQADRDTILQRLIAITQIGKSSRLKFNCEDPDLGYCGANPNTVFYCLEGSCGHATTGTWTLNVCGDRFWAGDYINGTDSGLGASQTGLLAHELAHLAGALDDQYTQNEPGLVAAAQDPTMSGHLTYVADAFRLYIMNTP